MKQIEKVIPILNDEYKVIVCFGDADKIKKCLKAWGHDEHATVSSLVGRRGTCFYSKDCHPVIAIPRRPKTPTEIGTLAHEATHAIEYIFDAIQQETRGELFAHSVGAVVRGTLAKGVKDKWMTKV